MKAFWKVIGALGATQILFSRRWLTGAGSGFVLMLAGQIALVQAPLALGELVNALADGNSVSYGLQIVGLYVALLIFGYILSESSDVVWFAMTEKLKAGLSVPALRTGLMARSQRSSTEGDVDSSGALFEQTERGVEALAMTVDAIIFRIIPKVLAIGVIVVTVSGRFSLDIGGIALLGCFLYIVWITVLHRQIVKYVRRASIAADVKSNIFIDFFSNKKVFHFFPEAFRLKFRAIDAAEAKRKANVDLVAFQTFWFAGNAIIVAVVTGLAISVFIFQDEALSDIGGVVSLTYLISMIFAPVSELSSGVQTAIAERTKALELEALLYKQPIITDTIKTKTDWLHLSLTDYQALDENGSPLHQPISLTIQRSSKIVVSGNSGIGKSTFLEALLRPSALYRGEIRKTDSQGNETKLSCLSDLAAFVPQQDLLFNIPMSENITLGAKGASLDLRRVISVAAIDGTLADRILNGKNQTGEAGQYLSGGERRRLSVARGLFSKKKLLLLDEPLSGLDMDAQNSLMRELFAYDDLAIVMVCHHSQWWDKFDKNVTMT